VQITAVKNYEQKTPLLPGVSCYQVITTTSSVGPDGRWTKEPTEPSWLETISESYLQMDKWVMACRWGHT